jgi:hypothetical protein
MLEEFVGCWTSVRLESVRKWDKQAAVDKLLRDSESLRESSRQLVEDAKRLLASREALARRTRQISRANIHL